MKSLVLINVFFGDFPWYFNLFLKSCQTNPTIKIYIFTNTSVEYFNIPKNVTFIPFSLQQFNRLASQKLNLDIDVKYPYKLCDFKPSYGIIFSDFIKDFEYWGITDIDIIFGRIREFISNEMLENYEVISVRNDYPTGAFMIFKNLERVNNLFKQSKDYRMVFTSDKHFCFDECNFEHAFFENGGDIVDADCEIESMYHVLKNEMYNNKLKVHFDFLIIEGLPGKLFWDKGLLSFKNEFEVLFYHLILYKDNQYTLKKTWLRIPDQFYIDKYMIRKSGFITKLYSLIYETIKVPVLSFVNSINYYVSIIIPSNFVKDIKPGLYINGKYSREIIKTDDKLIGLSVLDNVFPFRMSVLKWKSYVVKGFPDALFEYDNNVLKEVHMNGMILRYKLQHSF